MALVNTEEMNLQVQFGHGLNFKAGNSFTSKENCWLAIKVAGRKSAC